MKTHKETIEIEVPDGYKAVVIFSNVIHDEYVAPIISLEPLLPTYYVVTVRIDGEVTVEPRYAPRNQMVRVQNFSENHLCILFTPSRVSSCMNGESVANTVFSDGVIDKLPHVLYKLLRTTLHLTLTEHRSKENK